jgi:iron(III) transport system ATP-binding protein
VSRRTSSERAGELLSLVGCGQLGQRLPHELSGGQQQRVALARALVSSESLVLFDEPLSNVDAKVRDQLRNEIRRMHDDLGFAAVYVTHDQYEAMSLADRIAVLNEGRIVQVGTPAELYLEPASSFVADFVGSSNALPGTVTGAAGGSFRVTTSIGELAAAGTAHEVADGAAVIAVFRPEACTVNVRTAAAEEPAANVFPGVIEQCVFLGSEYQLSVEVHRVRILVSAREPDADRHYRPGTKVAVIVPPRAVRLLPESSPRASAI